MVILILAFACVFLLAKRLMKGNMGQLNSSGINSPSYYVSGANECAKDACSKLLQMLHREKKTLSEKIQLHVMASKTAMELSDSNDTIIELRQELECCKKQLESCSQEKAQLRKIRNSLQETIANEQALMKNQDQKMAQLFQERETLLNTQEHHIQRIEELEKQLTGFCSLRKAFENVEAEASALKERERYLLHMLQNKDEENTSLKSKLSNITALQEADKIRIADLEVTIEKKGQLIAELQQKQDSLDARYTTLEAEFDKQQSKISWLDSALQKARKEISEKKKELKSVLIKLIDMEETLSSVTSNAIIEVASPSCQNILADDRKYETTEGVRDYNKRNKHKRDKNLEFHDENHEYFVDGQKLKSVTTFVSECFPEFPLKIKASQVAKKEGVSVSTILKRWEDARIESATFGSIMHSNIEKYYLGEAYEENDVMPQFLHFAEENTLHPYRTEWPIYSQELGLAGTIDFLHYHDGEYVLYDWKRSKNIIENGQPVTKSKYYKKALAPISHIQDTSYWHYALQTSLYRYMLEQNYGIQVAKSRLVVMHPSLGHAYAVEVPYLLEEIEKLLQVKLKQQQD